MSHRTFTLQELSAYLHLEESDILLLTKRDEIPHEKLGDAFRFRRTEIDRWASQRLLGMSNEDMHDFHRSSTAKHHDLSARHALIPELVQYNYIDAELSGKTKPKVIRNMVDLAERTGMVWDVEGLLNGIAEREDLCSTALPGGVALLHPPHHEPYMFEDTFLVLGRTLSPVPFGAPDGKTTWIFFLICSQDDRIHLHLLARLGMICHRTDALQQLSEAETREDMFDILVAAEEEIIDLVK